LHIGLLGSPLRLVGIVLLTRNHALLGQVLPALGRHARQVLVAAALLEGGFGLLDGAVGLDRRWLGLADLLDEFGGFDLGQKPGPRDAVADIGVAPLDVPAGARQDRRFRDRLDVARQNQAGHGSARLTFWTLTTGRLSTAVFDSAPATDSRGGAAVARERTRRHQHHQQQGEHQQSEARAAERGWSSVGWISFMASP